MVQLNTQPFRVMVVDDEHEILDMVREFLSGRGYEVVTTTDGAEAVRLLGVAPIDVVLLDLAMPGTDGVSTLLTMRESHPDVPILVVTGNADVELGRETLRQGAFDYIAKPFDFNHLVRRIEAALACDR